MGGGTTVLSIVGLSMLVRFFEPDNWAWDMFLIVFVSGLFVAAYFLQRHLGANVDQIGEARFDTRNKHNG